LIEAAGKRGRYPFRDRVLVRLVYRHGLRASEAVGMRWSQLDHDAGTLHVVRLNGSTYSLDHDELRDRANYAKRQRPLTRAIGRSALASPTSPAASRTRRRAAGLADRAPLT
jgi:integrase